MYGASCAESGRFGSYAVSKGAGRLRGVRSELGRDDDDG